MNWCLGNEGPGSSKGYLCHSNIGSPGFSLCQGTTLRFPLARFGVISQVASSVGNPDLRCVIISFRHLSFVVSIVITTDSFTSCFAQLRDDLNLRAGIRGTWRRQLSTQRRLSAGMTLWTRVLLPFIV